MPHFVYKIDLLFLIINVNCDLGITNRNECLIPVYQRNYDWKKQQCINCN